MDKNPISTHTLRRLPIYLSYLRDRRDPRVSATTVAGALRLSEVQVRKDLAAISDGGRPGVGYETEALIRDIERYLGYDGELKAVLVGAGNLGRALLGYEGFRKCGLRIIAAFDADAALFGRTIAGRAVYPMAALAGICHAEEAKLGIITVPDAAAQEALNRLVESGIRAEMSAVDTVVNPKILNVMTGEFIRFILTLSAGDTLVVSTGYADKWATFTQDGTEEDALKYLDIDSTFLKLDPGDNLIKYEADAGVDNLEIVVFHNNRYLGV